MANKNTAIGMIPYGALLRATPYVAGGTFYVGAPVKMDNSGRIVAAAAGDALIGVALSNGTAAAECLVADQPDQRFLVQCDGTAVDAQTDIGNVADLVIGSASATYKIARAELDSTTLSATASAQLQILAVESKVDNALGADVKVIVRINEHQLVNAATGV